MIPLTFTITVNKFKNVIQKFSLENDMPAITVCRLFDNLTIMSKYVNSNWGMVCLIWAFYYSTRNVFELIVWSSHKDTIGVVDTIFPVMSPFLLLYFSGDVYCKVSLKK